MRAFAPVALALLVGSAHGCGLIAGLGDFEDAPTTGVGGSTGGGGSSGAGGAGGSGGSTPPSPTAVYAVSFGGVGADKLLGLGTDASREVYFAGTHGDDIAIDDDVHTTTEPDNVFVASLSENFGTKWSHSWPFTDTTTVEDLATGSGGVTTVVGVLKSPVDFGGGLLTPDGEDAYVARFEADGSHQFSAHYGDAEIQGTYAVDSAGAGFVAGGVFRGVIDLGPGPVTAAQTDGFLTRFDYVNVEYWTKYLTDANGMTPLSQDVRAISVDSAGQRVYVAGLLKAAADFGGVIFEYGGASSHDAYVLALDSTTGNYVHHVVFSDAADIVPRDIVFTGASVVVVGHFAGNLVVDGNQLYATAGGRDGFVVQLDTDLNLLNAVHIGGIGTDDARSVDTDGQGAVVVVGEFSNTVDFGAGMRTAAASDAFVLKLGADLSHLWSGAYGGSGSDAAYRVAIDGLDNIVVGGQFVGQIDFGSDVLVSQGDLDVFLAKFPPSPE